MAEAREQKGPSPEQIMQDFWAARRTLTLIAGIELDLFTQIAAGNHSPKEIARAAGTDKDATRRLLDALVAMTYLKKRGDNYDLEPVAGAFLVRGREPFIGGFAFESRLNWDAWARLPEVVKTGKPVTKVDAEEEGREFFPKLVKAIFPMSYAAGRAAAASLSEKSRKRIKTILDIAAGSAAWSLAFAQAIPDAQVTVLDFPEVTPIAREFTEKFGVADRYDYIEGNLREVKLPRGKYDLVILGHIIHSEGAKWGSKLIKKSYQTLKEGGQLLIADMIPNDKRTGPELPLIFGLNMLIHTEQGDVYTMKEYREWLKAAGFKRVTTIDVPGPSPLILATK